MADVSMRILLQAIGGNSVVSSVKSIATSLGSGGLGGALLAVGVAAGTAAIGLGVASVKAASSFQTAMDANIAHAGLAKDQVNNVTNALLQMGPAVGQSPTVLATALYPVLSSLSGITNQGAKTSLALDEVKMAAESVAGSTTSVTSVTNAASAAFNAYGLQTNNATTNTARMNNLFDTMNNTISAGNMQWSAYSNVIGKLSVTSHAAGVGFNETNAALADLTNQGYSAQLGATYLGNTYTTLYTKADTVAKNAQSLGLSFDATKYKTMDLGDRIKYLTQVTGGNQTELLKLMGGNSTALKTFDALSNSIGNYQSNLTSLNNSQGATATAFATASSSFAFGMQRIQAAGQSLLITIGLKLLPVLTQVENAVLPIIANFTQLFTSASPLSPIFANISGMLNVMKNNWQSMAPAVAPVLQAFQKFGAMLTGTLPGAISQFLRIMNDINNVIIIVATAVSAWIAPALSILSQLWQGLLTAMTPILNAVENQLMPAFQNLVTAIAPIVTHILQWIAHSGVITPLLKTLGAVISVVVTVVSHLINGLASIIKFFTQTQLGVDILKAALITLGIVLGVIAVVVLPGLIAGFIATAIEAVITGATMIVAFLPIILIVVVVVAIITLVILAIQHWGAIAHWLQGVWAAIATFFAGVWKGIEKIFSNIGAWFAQKFKQASDGVKSGFGAVGAFFSGIWKGVQSAFGNVGGWFSDKFKQAGDGVKSGFGATGNWFKQQGEGLKSTASNIGKGVSDAFNWMYQHNYYWAAMVNGIKSIIATLKSWLTSAWNFIKNTAASIWNGIKNTAISVWTSVTTFLTNLWKSVSGIAHTAWTAVSTVIMTVINTLVGWIKTFWNDEVTGLTNIWHSISGIAQTAWTAVSKVVTNAVNILLGWLKTFWNNEMTGLSNIWHTLSGIAQSVWNAVTGVFKNAWGGISNALSGLWTNISGWFSNLAKQALQWGGNFISSLASGITNAAGKVSDAASGVASNIEKFLGFHSPAKAGPGSHLLEWPKNMLAAYGKAMEAAAPQLQSSLNVVMRPVASTLSGQNGAPALNVASPTSSSANGGQIINVFNITVNGVVGNKNDVVTWIEKDLSQRLNKSGRLATTRSGGRAAN